ncbi:MAG TPA: maleylpyruvate isomerase family mycothiol-dependent enzyme [Dermatophilaceae bacterium]|nr:maleylpyruvate isomerase family mycothiol-dependent enzyme [Dermatophilaceae bacterium]
MDLTPRPPESLAELTAAYEQTVSAMVELARELGAGEEDRPTDCPGWTVGDQVRHVESIESALAGEPAPDVDVGHLPHVRHDFGARVERWLQSRRGRPLDAVAAHLEELRARRTAHLRDPATSGEDPTTGPFGPTTEAALTGVRTFDIWVHEQDLREALGQPGDLDTPAAANAVARVLATLPRVAARQADLPAGAAVVVEVTGPVTGRAGARVVERDGARHGIPLEGEEPTVAPEVTAVALSTRDLTRLAAGRRRADELTIEVTGDAEVARRLLDAWVVTP